MTRLCRCSPLLGLVCGLVLSACAGDDEVHFNTGGRGTGGGGGGGAAGAGGSGASGPAGLAVFGVPNADDDDTNGQADWLDEPFDADNDFATFALPEELRAAAALTDSFELELAGDVDAIRLWQDDEVVLGAVDGSNARTRFAWSARDADAPLRVEFADFRSEGTLSVRHVDSAGAEVAAFDVTLLAAPLVIHHHLQPTARVWAVSVSSNQGLIAELQSVLGSLFTPVDSPDIWIQDELQWAAATAPGMALHVAMDSIRNREIDAFVKSLKAPDVQPMTWGEAGSATTEDKFGNLEVTPPHTAGGVAYPLGRIYYGATDESGPNQTLTEFLDAQGVQAPLRVDTSWLCVGHVDEFLTFVPDPDSATGFKLLVADVDAAYAVLDAMPASTTLPHYGNLHGYPTVGDIVSDSTLRDLNAQVQADWLDPQRDQLMAELELDAAALVRVPALFERVPFCPYSVDFMEVAALIPAMVNLAVVTVPEEPVRLFVPDPRLRPTGASQASDPLIQAFRAAMPPALELHFVDTWYPYHAGGGEIHCGTSVARTPEGQWWSEGWHLLSGPSPLAGHAPSHAWDPALRAPSFARQRPVAQPRLAGLPAPIRTRYGTLRFADPALENDHEATRRLLDALARQPEKQLRAAIIDALPRTRGDWAAGALRHLRRERDPDVRQLVVAIMRRAAPGHALQALALAVRDPAPQVRAEAAFLAAAVPANNLREARLLGPVRALRDDPDRRVRNVAARTLHAPSVVAR